MRPDKYCALTLVERIDVTDELAVFRFHPDEKLPFTPGQYATLALLPEGAERPVQRPYSVASAPHEEVMEFFVERVGGGALTPLLWALGPGDRCWVRRRIVGLFVLEHVPERPRHVLAATVTGVAPYVSIVRALRHVQAAGLPTPENASLGDAPQLLVVHGASRSAELGPYRAELERAAAASGWLAYVPTVSRPWEDPTWPGGRGRVGDVLRKHMDAAGLGASAAVGYACGHPLMIRNVKAIFQRAGLPPEHVHEEQYFRA